jgi:murein DD-endopeptidase MepM/ murein hydrolase activator NlpD
MELKKVFLLFILQFINNNSSIYTNINNSIKNHNFFEVVIPIKMINDSLDFYLPSNLKKDDKNKIINFILEHQAINNLNKNNIFYKICFYKNYHESSLDKIVLYENENNLIKHISTLNSLEKSPAKYNQSQKNKIITKNKKYTNLVCLNFHYKNKEKLKVIDKNTYINIIEILEKIDNFISKKHKTTDYSYEIYYDTINKKILGVKIFNEGFKENLFVLYTEKKKKYIILDNNYQNINPTVIGLYNSGPVVDVFKKLRSPFGSRRDPFTKKMKMHRGQDITMPLNTPITTVEDGVIVDCGYNKSYGYFIIVHHGYNTRDSYSSVYCHLNNILLPIGTKVLKNEVIGLSGSTGRSTGPHLHLEWVSNSDENRIDPVKVYYQNKKIGVFFQKKIIKIKEVINNMLNSKY